MKPRILYIIESYPTITETYIDAEIEALRDQYEIKVIAQHPAVHVNHKHHDHFEICGPARLFDAAKEFKPDAIHTHWLIHVPLVASVAAELGVPFTVRAHSFDGIWQTEESTPPDAAQMVQFINSDLCLSVLGFPFMRRYFERAGIAGHKIRDSYPCMRFQQFFDQGPNGLAVMSGGADREAKQMEELALLATTMPELEFNLYATGEAARRVEELNPRVKIRCVQPDRMPAEYKKHRWLVLTAANQPNARGWPMMIAEAQASGVGVCMRNLRTDLAEYVGECGFLYDSIEELPDIISKPFPDELRRMGFEQAKKSDVAVNVRLLSNLWDEAIIGRRNKPAIRSGDTYSPRVSVILPTFNRAATLKRAIDSVLNQTFRDLELLIVDDGSNDHTQALLDDYRRDNRVRLFSQPHQGCAKARNLGLQQARAAYLAFQDSDDEWFSHKLEKSFELLTATQAEVALLYSDMLYIQGDGRASYFSAPSVTRGMLIDENRLEYQVAGIGLASALIKRKCLEAVGEFDEHLNRFIDLDLFIRLCDRFDFLHCREPLVKYYASDGISADWQAEVLARQYLMKKYEHRLQKHHVLAQQLLVALATERFQNRALKRELADQRSYTEAITAALLNTQTEAAGTRAALDAVTASRSWRALQTYARLKRSLLQKTFKVNDRNGTREHEN